MAHPLLDRRDLTAARERASVTPPAAPVVHHDGLGELEQLLTRLVRQERARLEQLCVTDTRVAESAMDNFPVPGARRLVVHRTGAGGLLALTAGVPTQLLAPNEARLGGQVVVSGAGAVVLYLSADLLTSGGATPLGSGAAQIWLASGGGSWDMRLAGTLWCGTVIAVAQANSSVTVAEV